MVKADDDQDMNLEYKWTGLFVQSIILILISCYHPVAMATIRCLILLCSLLVGVNFSFVNSLGYSSEGQEQDLGQSQGRGQIQRQDQSIGSFGGGREGGFGQPEGFSAGSGVSRPGVEGKSYGGSQYGGQPGVEDARQYNFRIYTEPEYYGYESKFPGGKAMFKSYRSAESRLGRHGQQSQYDDDRARSGKSYDNFGPSEGQQQPQY
ncbi:heterogeneous nuclear ribonucleoprotein A1-like isoform X3 [Zootermopsis nevadensis]|uniref:Uncharacterized protein n=1 Tax=Zootermopsis nevadensis TaxID=136037 RepID=A0A067R060_ZOONE|nr:heterogeneous nuclear ribonucleoprotein A1-like isoform X2 [Zootermopsis nevadensis]XP_021935753.1 heterogeneous nuclear ribonucleoprotein A1-like isoform X3 [Zootermopsis nevadensis]KDR10815.1 hypothetical protein L798_14908 [Zootermopsis nevadensis]